MMPDYATKADLNHHKDIHDIRYEQILGQVQDISGDIKEVSSDVKETLGLINIKLSEVEKQQVASAVKWKIATYISGTSLCLVGGVLVERLMG